MNVLAVGIGGFLGAILRYGMSRAMPPTNAFPLATLLINLLGCLFLAWFLTMTSKRWPISPHLKLAVGTGFTGAFTTFSTFSVETWTLVQNKQFTLATLYILLSVLGGVGLAVTGSKLATRERKGRA